jgi:HAD superfamily hydrolase (TIGR01509 family)
VHIEGLAAILLDLDGTLIESHGVLWDAYASFLHLHGVNPSRAEFAALDGPSIPQIVIRLREIHALAEPVSTLQAEYRAAVGREYPSAPATVGADDLLSRLDERFRVGLVTSAPSDLAKQAVLRRGWAGRFEVMVTGEDGPAKPAPGLYLEALARLALGPESALAVEDSVNGVRAAAAAGLAVVGVTPLQERALQLREAGAAEVVADLREVAELVL